MNRPVRVRASDQPRMPTDHVPDVKEDKRGQAGTTIHRRKSLTPEAFTKTHGLPEPDGPLHKGSIFRQLLAPLRPGRMLDLGAGKGNFSLSAAELGWEVTAVDARTVRWPDAETEPDPAVAERIRAIRSVQADVRTFPIAPGNYDLIEDAHDE